MAGCGRAARLRRGWLANSAWYRSRHSVAGKRSRRLAGRSRSRVRRTRNQPRRKKWPHLKKALGCHCRGGGEASRQTHRGLRHGRAPHRPETRHAARLGAHRRASDRAWPSPVRLAIGERPIAHGHHRFDWLYVTAFASPATGETFWYLSNGVSKEFFEALLETFAREAEAGVARIILLVLDNAGWQGPANLKIPDGIRLIYLPPYSPELQPAETLWALVDDPIVNKHIANIEELDEQFPRPC